MLARGMHACMQGISVALRECMCARVHACVQAHIAILVQAPCSGVLPTGWACKRARLCPGAMARGAMVCSTWGGATAHLAGSSCLRSRCRRGVQLRGLVAAAPRRRKGRRRCAGDRVATSHRYRRRRRRALRRQGRPQETTRQVFGLRCRHLPRSGGWSSSLAGRLLAAPATSEGAARAAGRCCLCCQRSIPSCCGGAEDYTELVSRRGNHIGLEDSLSAERVRRDALAALLGGRPMPVRGRRRWGSA